MKFTSEKNCYLQTEAEFFTFTTDNCTSQANDAYLPLTCKFTTSRWDVVMVTCVLATPPFPEHYAANNMVEKIHKVTEDYGLEKKNLLSVVHDQCLNMELAGDILHQETGNCQSYSCTIHHLKLCIEESLHITVISEALTVAKKLVTHF